MMREGTLRPQRKKLTAKQQAILTQEEHIKKQELRLEKKKKDAGL